MANPEGGSKRLGKKTRDTEQEEWGEALAVKERKHEKLKTFFRKLLRIIVCVQKNNRFLFSFFLTKLAISL
jgi:hypothetical protein